MSAFLHSTQTDLPAEAFLAAAGDAPPQEVANGCRLTRAWLVTSAGRPYFVKWTETARYDALLAKDAEICRQALHPAIVRVLNVVQTADGMLLVFEKLDGETLSDTARRARFFALPAAAKMSALRALFGALAAIADAGWIIVDFYEGNVLYDYATGTVKVFDFELFERGNGFVLQLDRNYGSSRLMSPEEFRRGSLIDQRSNVYTLGRYAIHALSRRADESWRAEWQAGDVLADVIARATHPRREDRYPTVRAFVEAFQGAVSGGA